MESLVKRGFDTSPNGDYSATGASIRRLATATQQSRQPP
jgi:hypothetical protein